ncbi:MAG: hypothetical protein FJ161_04330 [Gammaproteobacteria bacterium]|nr:hypothetical protein [Gammaproteobacteria bacterium]
MNSHELVIHRNLFYQKLAYRQCGVFFALCLLIIGSYYVIQKIQADNVQPTYFMTDRYGHILPDIPLSQPYFSNDHVEKWTTEKLTTLFSMNFANYKTILNEASGYFNPIGYSQYLESINNNRIISALTVHKYVAVVDLLEPLRVSKTLSFDQGAFAWLLTGKMRVTYFNEANIADPFVQELHLTVVVRRENFALYEDGISLRVIIA